MRRLTLLAVAVSALLTVAAACGSSEASSPAPPAPDPCQPVAEPTTIAYRDLPGVDEDLVSLDIYPAPDTCSAPVVLWVHGGGYRAGDKANQMTDKVRLFNDNGWTLVSVNYRLTVPGDPTSARHPDHFDDVAAAVAWVSDNIADWDGDPERLALLGHSAGADIVSNVTHDPQHLDRHGLGLDAIACTGPLDTEGFDKAAAGAGARAQWEVALGNLPTYEADTSATLLVDEDMDIPDTIGVIRGTARRQDLQATYLDTLAEAGVPTTRIDARGLSHAEVSRNIGAPGDAVMTEPLVSFLTDCFGP